MKKIIKVFTDIDWSSISTGTYVRYIVMILTIINTILIRIGKTPISVEEEQVYQTVSDVITIVVLIVNTYKNNSTSWQAIQADAYLQNLKGDNVEYDNSIVDTDEDESAPIEDTDEFDSNDIEESYEDVEDV